MDVRFKKIMADAALADIVFLAQVDGLLDTALELGDFPELAMTLDGVVQLGKAARQIAEDQLASGKINIADLAPVRYHQLTNELRVVQVRQARGKAK